MKTHILTGSKQEITESLAQISGEVRQAIVFVDELAPPMSAPGIDDPQDIFAEMRPFMVDVQEMDDSREAIYSPVKAG